MNLSTRWLKFAGIAGVVVVVFGLLVLLTIETTFAMALISSHLVVGGLLLVAWFFLYGMRNLGSAPTVFKGRTARFSANVTLYAAVFFGLLVAVNWLGVKHSTRWDLTETGIFSLSDQSQKIISTLKNPLKIVVLTNGPRFNIRLQDMAKLYEYNGKDKVSVEFLDPNSKPTLVDKYQLTQGDQVYLRYGDEKKIIGDMRLKEISEEGITNAIIKLTQGEAKKVYYVEGHDEPDIKSDAPNGYKNLAEAIKNEHFDIESIILAQNKQIPENAAAVILASPKQPLLKEEKELLLSYVKQGGRLIMLTDPRTSSDVKEISAEFGIEVKDNVVVDEVQRVFAGPQLGVQVLVRDFGFHPITRDMTDRKAVVFLMASSLAQSANKEKSAVYTDLLRSGNKAWGEANLNALFDSENPSAEKGDEDQIGPVTLAISYENRLDKAAEKPEEGADPQINKVARVVVFGDSDWLSNPNLSVYSNKDMFLNSLGWVAGVEGGISIRPRGFKTAEVPIEKGTYQAVLSFSFLVPELILLIGLFVWWRRRTVAV